MPHFYIPVGFLMFAEGIEMRHFANRLSLVIKTYGCFIFIKLHNNSNSLLVTLKDSYAFLHS